MEGLVTWFTEVMAGTVSEEVIVFVISLMPILELRGGLLAAKLLGVELLTAIPICVAGNIIPIPFILLFIRKIFAFMKKHNILRSMVERLEKKAMGKSDKVANMEFWGLALFVGIPLPGTGAWTGSLIAALLEMDIKKAVIAELVGVVIATIIMSIVSYGLLGLFI